MKNYLSQTILDKTGTRKVSGDFGVEIEIEGTPGIYNDYGNWQVKHDGSLRGEGAREYVFRQPANLGAAKADIVELYSRIKSAKGRINSSMRAGVHVHVNVQSMTVLELFTFLTAYFCLEGCFNRNFGEEREGNLFCMRISDAEYLNFFIEEFFRSESKNLAKFSTDSIRYSAANLSAIPNYGSVEFRSLQTPVTPEPILEWIDVLHALKTNSVSVYKTPEDILFALSAGGYEEVVRNLLGDHANFVLRIPDAEELILESMRIIQTWVLTTDWK
jgi:hypothetical protein